MIRRRYQILAIALGVVAVAVAAGAFALSHNSCGAAASSFEGAQRMKAVVYHCYGSSDVLSLAEIAMPTPADDEVLVKVRAVAVNPYDWHFMTGTPYIMRLQSGMGAPKRTRFGVDFAGIVAAVGQNVTRFKLGDEVFGGRPGAMAEYVAVRADGALALKPANVSFAQAAAIPIAAITALQGLRDKGRLQPGQKVLINGASGGVGTFAVQIAKALGAEVTAVCSTRNAELVRSLGADHVIDYTKTNFTEGTERYDLVLDNVGNHSLLATRRVLKSKGILVIISGSKENRWIGPLSRPIVAALLSPFVSQEMGMMMANSNHDDLNVLGELVRTGKVTPVIDRQYSLHEAAAAMGYLAEGHARGKVVVTLE